MADSKKDVSVNVNKEFLQNILQAKENDSSLVVNKCNVKDGVGKGQGYLSNMLRVEAEVMRNGQLMKECLIVKTLPKETSSEEFVAENSAFPNEMNMFSETLLQMSELLKSVGKPPEIGAKFYYCKKTLPFMLIVEDLAAKGFKMASRRNRLDFNHCLLVMKTLGRYHAASIVIHDLNPMSIERYKSNLFSEDNGDKFFENNYLFALSAAAPVADGLYPEGQNYGERLKQRAKTLRKDIKDLFILDRNSLNVLLHGDLWTNNMMFKYDESSGEVQEVRFVDFQFSCYASAGIDLQYFITSSPTEDVIVNHTDDLLRTYHSELCETLQSLGYGQKEISFDQLLREYDRNILFAFKTALTIVPIFLADVDDDFDFVRVAENDNVSEGFRKRVSNPLYIPMLKRILPVLDKKGTF